jgi:fatty acid desaturase
MEWVALNRQAPQPQRRERIMLRYRADRRSIGFVTFYFALVLVQWVWAPSQLWVAVPLLLTTCFFSWFCAIITHNAVHSPVFVNKRLNKVFQVVLTLTYGNPVSSFVSGHNLSHHKHTQTSRDVMRTTKMRFRSNLLNMLLFFPTVALAVTLGDLRFTKAMRTQRPRWFRQLVFEFVALWGVTLLLFVLDWQKALLYWLIPHIYAAWGIISMNYLQHDGCDHDSEYNHSRNFTGKLFGWFTFNNGFHTIHHMRPGLHWSLTREAHEREIEPHIDPRLDEPSIARYIWRAFIWPGKRERYDQKPVELPRERQDADWIPDLRRPGPDDASLGAER